MSSVWKSHVIAVLSFSKGLLHFSSFCQIPENELIMFEIDRTIKCGFFPYLQQNRSGI